MSSQIPQTPIAEQAAPFRARTDSAAWVDGNAMRHDRRHQLSLEAPRGKALALPTGRHLDPLPMWREP